jgi:hypothetical protein
MEELRSEIRAAFEKEQAAHPPVAAMRRNVVEAVVAQPRRKPNLQWVAVAAAAILGILVVAGLVSTRFGHRASVPAATPQAGQLKDYGPPPAGVPLIYLIDPRNGAWLQAYDWQGQPRGTIKLPQPVASGYRTVFAAPDGSAFLYQPEGSGGITQYLDRLGRPIASSNGLESASLWADDSRHLCIVRFESLSGEWRLFTKLPGEADHLAGIIPTGPNIDQAAISPASCSFRNDQAIVVNGTRTCCAIQSPSELWVFRISDGKVLSDYTYSNPGSVATVVASGDGLLIAEKSSQTGTTPPTVIRRVSDRSVVASLDPSLEVLAFSGDDSLVFIRSAPGGVTAGQPALLSVIDLRSGRVTWHEQAALMTEMEQPNGSDFAISFVASVPKSTTGPLGTFLIVHGDGSVTRIPGSYTPA